MAKTSSGGGEKKPSKDDKQGKGKVSSITSDSKDPKSIHKLINLRYKALRKEGLTAKEAMLQARDEIQPGKDNEKDPRRQVAALFGVL